MIVKYLDETPAEGINISLEINDYNGREKYIKYYSSDASGIIKFTLPPVRDEKSRFTIQVRVYVSPNQCAMYLWYLYNILYTHNCHVANSSNTTYRPTY